jgi:hypothetical protein
VDRPTITCEPIDGEMLVKMLLAPVPFDAVMNLVRAGYRADRLQTLYLRSLNGIRTKRTVVPGPPVDARYLGLILVILFPWIPRPAMSPFWPKMKA